MGAYAVHIHSLSSTGCYNDAHLMLSYCLSVWTVVLSDVMKHFVIFTVRPLLLCCTDGGKRVGHCSAQARHSWQ